MDIIWADGLGILYGNQPPVGQSLDTGTFFWAINSSTCSRT